jgi:hypothetical protein
MARYVCSGRSSGRDEVCSFTTESEEEAFRHFEQYDHDVDDTFTVSANGKCTTYGNWLTDGRCPAANCGTLLDH